MNDPQQITPTLRLGNLGLMVVAAFGVICFVLLSREPLLDGLDLNRGELVACGCVYGLAASGYWLASAIGHRYLRLASRAAVVIGAVALYGLLRELRNPFQSAADFLGLCVVQCLLFHVCHVPRCVWGRARSVGDSRRQAVAIADLGITTTGVALVLAMTIRFTPNIEPLHYWLLAAAAWIGGGSIATCLAKGMTSRQPMQGTATMLCGLAVAVAGILLLAIVDLSITTGEVSRDDVTDLAASYGRIVAGYIGTFLLFTMLALISPLAKFSTENANTTDQTGSPI